MKRFLDTQEFLTTIAREIHEATTLCLLPRFVLGREENSFVYYCLNDGNIRNANTRVASLFVLKEDGELVLRYLDADLKIVRLPLGQPVPKYGYHDKLQTVLDCLIPLLKRVIAEIEKAPAEEEAPEEKEDGPPAIGKIVNVIQSNVIQHKVTLDNGFDLKFVGDYDNLEIGNYVYLPKEGPLEILHKTALN